MFGPPSTWMSDNATHFRNRVVRKLVKALGVEHRFSVANSAWTNGTVQRMMREVIHEEKRQQRTRARSTALGHSRTARRPRGEDVVLRR